MPCYSRVGAGVLVFSTQTEDLLAGVAGCLERFGGLPRTLVWDRQAGIHGQGGRPSEAFAAFCGQLRVGWRFCERAIRRPRAPSSGCGAKVNTRTHKTLRARPVDRLAGELAVMAPLPREMPDCDRRWVARVRPDPHLRVDTNDYSLDPALVDRRVEVIVGQRTVIAVALDTGELAYRHPRVFARHRMITALEHARAVKAGRRAPVEPQMEVRPLARFDALIA